MAREKVGACSCIICSRPAEVRENVKNKLYLYCPESCGLVQATGAGAQEHMRKLLEAAQPIEGEAVEIKGEELPAPVADSAVEGPEGPTNAPQGKSWMTSLLEAKVL